MLLNACIMKQDPDFIRYVEKKILKRLGVLAAFKANTTNN